MKPKHRYYLFCLLLLGFAALFGIHSRNEHFAYPEIIRQYAGDTMWAFAAYFLIRTILMNQKTRSIFIYALLLSVTVELSQLLKHPVLAAIRSNKIGGLLIGFGFHWEDLLCYLAGCTLAFIFDNLFVFFSNK